MPSGAAFPPSKTAVPLVFGAMTVGAKGNDQARITEVDHFQQILDVLKAHGQDEIDSR